MWYHRWASSLGELEDTPEKIWGTLPYDADKHQDENVVFCGLYGFPDFYALWRHKGKKAVWWCGSDITHFKNGYWLEDGGSIRISPKAIAKWINKNCENWVENEVEKETLEKFGIKCNVCPSFLGDISSYEVSFVPSDKPKLYASVSGDDFKLYKWDLIEELATINQGVEFHLYGNRKPWETKNKNVIVHGRVPKEQMNSEVKKMQGGLRLLAFDGFSEVIAKSLLWGQWPVSFIKYPHTLSISEIGKLKDLKKPNLEGRKYYQNILNKYPWKR